MLNERILVAVPPVDMGRPKEKKQGQARKNLVSYSQAQLNSRESGT